MVRVRQEQVAHANSEKAISVTRRDPVVKGLPRDFMTAVGLPRMEE